MSEKVSYELYEELETEKRRLEDDYHSLNFRHEELILHLQEWLQSKDCVEKIGEFYEWLREEKYL